MSLTAPAPCDRCGQVAPMLFFLPSGRLLCCTCHAIEVPAPAPEPKRRGRLDACHCGLCTAPVLPGFEVKS